MQILEPYFHFVLKKMEQVAHISWLYCRNHDIIFFTKELRFRNLGVSEAISGTQKQNKNLKSSF